MAIDERIQFLVQSTESLHANAQEMTASLVELRGTVANMTRALEIDADNIRRLANIAAAPSDNIEDLGARLDRLERRAKDNS
jgi:hypothetical protein